MSFSSIDAIFNGLSVADLYTQGNYSRENNAIDPVEIIHYTGRRNIIRTERRLSFFFLFVFFCFFCFVFFLGELNKNHSNSHYDKG